jgi:chaperonin GroES
MTTTFTPLGKRLLVRRDEASKATKSGILIPENAVERPARGTVIAISEDIKADGLVKGATVAFGQWAGQEIDIDGEKLVILKDEDVLGLINATTGREYVRYSGFDTLNVEAA